MVRVLVFLFLLGTTFAHANGSEYGIKDVLEKCLKFCPKIHSPVCDNEGITHNSQCEFEIRKCVAKETSGRDLRVVHPGVCLDKRSGIKPVLEKCLKFCPKIMAPVCDNEGITHYNKCEFEIRQCIARETSGREIRLVHRGVCLDKKGIKDTLDKCLRNCPKEMRPVCDNEGITHANRCVFEMRRCVRREETGNELRVVRDGVCLN